MKVKEILLLYNLITSQPPAKNNDNVGIMDNNFATGIVKQWQNMMTPNNDSVTDIATESVTEDIPLHGNLNGNRQEFSDASTQYAEMSQVVKEELGIAMKPELYSIVLMRL